MKIVVKNGVVVATHNDNQNINSSYPGCVFRKVPNGLVYNSPVIAEDPRTRQLVSRTSIEVLDPDPMKNLTNFSLTNCQIIAGESISEEVNQFIQYKSTTGEVRYTQAKQSSFTDILMYCEKWLSDNPAATPEEKLPYETRITLINSARSWIRDVLSYYYDKVAEIRAVTVGTLSSLTWDFTTFEASDPDVWLETVRL